MQSISLVMIKVKTMSYQISNGPVQFVKTEFDLGYGVNFIHM